MTAEMAESKNIAVSGACATAGGETVVGPSRSVWSLLRMSKGAAGKGSAYLELLDYYLN